LGGRSVGMTRPWPRMMRRATAAAYCDLSAAEFEREVSAGRLPQPIKLGNSEHWSQISMDEMLSRMTGETMPNWREKSPLYTNAA
jgi:predicted DNA-binding transcriptional regulator AlpA